MKQQTVIQTKKINEEPKPKRRKLIKNEQSAEKMIQAPIDIDDDTKHTAYVNNNMKKVSRDDSMR